MVKLKRWLNLLKMENNNIDYKCWTTDDLCLSNLRYFKHWDFIKEKKPELKLIAFTIANYQGKEDLSQSKEFKEFYEKRKDWLTIQPHGYDHQRVQIGWRSYEEQKKDIQKCLEILKSYLPDKVIFRFPGFRTMSYSERILRECGVDGIAFQGRIKYFDTGEIVKTFDTHCGNEGKNQIKDIYQDLIE